MPVDGEALETVRLVLTGKISRTELASMNVRSQLYAAIALIFARRSEFLTHDNALRVPYLKVFERLLIQGAPTKRCSEVFRTLGYREGLYRSAEGQVYLTPPAELKGLVAWYGKHPAVERFFQDVSRAQREEWFRTVQIQANKDPNTSYWSTLAARIEEQGGTPALLAMGEVIQARLNALAEEADENDGM